MVMIKFDCQEILDIVRTMDRPEPPAIFEVKTVKTMEEYDEAIIQSTVYRIACSVGCVILNQFSNFKNG